MRRGRTWYAVSLGLAVAGGLGGSKASAQAWAGWRELRVDVVESGPSEPPVTWALAGPIRSIGRVDGAPPFLFTYVWDAERTSDGRIVVVETTSHEIRTFTSDGRHQTTFGGRGGGPREFGGPPWISLDEDTLVVWDPGHYRRSRYTVDGDLIDQTTIRDVVLELGITPFPDGRVWETSAAGVLWTGSVGLRPVAGLNAQFRRLVWIGADETHEFGSFRSGRMHLMRGPGGGFRGIPDPFAPSTVAAVSGDGRVAVAEGDSAHVLIYGPDHGPERLIVADIGRRSASAELAASYRDRTLGMAGRLGVSRRQVEEAYDEIGVPDSVPAIGDLIWSDTGDLWIGRRAGDVWAIDEYHVFGADGRWRARVPVPEGVDRVLDIGGDHVLARSSDDLGVQYLDLYTVVR